MDDLNRSTTKHRPEKFSDFRKYLDEVDRHPNRRYFTLKSIVIGNLYGVDIMEEAVEICKLRLFLKLAAQADTVDELEPLPDIDFNIRAGNTLVGFTSLDAVRRAMTVTPDGQHRQVFPEEAAVLNRVEEAAEVASRAFDRFREQQTALGGEVTANDKADLRHRLQSLGGELDRYLATEYGIDLADPAAYADWRSNHQPFHWFAEFHGIMRQGGFDAVIGNPPYVEYRKIRREYTLRGFVTERCGNLYAMMIERSYDCLRLRGRFGMIVQLSYSCTERMEPIQQLCISQSSHLWLSHFDDRPAKLFDGLEHIRATIVLSQRSGGGVSNVHSTAYNRWYTEARPQLFNHIEFDTIPNESDVPCGTVPKIGPLPASAVLGRIAKHRPIRESLESRGNGNVHFHNAPQYWGPGYGLCPLFLERTRRRAALYSGKNPESHY